MTTKHSIYIVNIHGTEHAVRATGKRAAQQAAIDDRIATRKASDDDIIRICRSGQAVIGDLDTRTETERVSDDTCAALTEA